MDWIGKKRRRNLSDEAITERPYREVRDASIFLQNSVASCLEAL
jgi:hypothetical protein